MKIATVNVIDLKDASTYQIDCLESYPDTPKGNREAEETFKDWCNEANGKPLSKKKLQEGLENGCMEFGTGAILIVHSIGGKILIDE